MKTTRLRFDLGRRIVARVLMFDPAYLLKRVLVVVFFIVMSETFSSSSRPSAREAGDRDSSRTA